MNSFEDLASDYIIAATNTASLLKEVERRWLLIPEETREMLDARDFLYDTLEQLRQEKMDEEVPDEVFPNVGW